MDRLNKYKISCLNIATKKIFIRFMDHKNSIFVIFLFSPNREMFFSLLEQSAEKILFVLLRVSRGIALTILLVVPGTKRIACRCVYRLPEGRKSLLCKTSESEDLYTVRICATFRKSSKNGKE